MKTKFNNEMEIYRIENKNQVLMFNFACKCCAKFRSCSHSKHKGLECEIGDLIVKSEVFNTIVKVNKGNLTKWIVDTENYFELHKARALLKYIEEQYSR